MSEFQHDPEAYKRWQEEQRELEQEEMAAPPLTPPPPPLTPPPGDSDMPPAFDTELTLEFGGWCLVILGVIVVGCSIVFVALSQDGEVVSLSLMLHRISGIIIGIGTSLLGGLLVIAGRITSSGE